MRDPLQFTFGSFHSFVRFGNGLDTFLTELEDGILTVFDRNTHALFGKEAANPVVLEPGEKNKSWQNVEKIIEAAIKKGLGRDGVFVGIGGGVICDLTAFSASIFMRGCRLVLVPTSLLSMVDAAIGGKTGINIGNYKNMAGTFYPAEEIRLSIGALATLPAREFKSGLAEAVKTAMLGDAELFHLLQDQRRQIMSREPSVLEEIIGRCIAAKGKIVEQDFQENGRRAILNLGHTFAHALETVGGLESWNHGEAVAWGLAKAVELGIRMGVTEKNYGESVRRILSDYEYQLEIGRALPVSDLVQAMHVDKKKQQGRLRLVIPRGICDTFIDYVEDGIIQELLK